MGEKSVHSSKVFIGLSSLLKGHYSVEECHLYKLSTHENTGHPLAQGKRGGRVDGGTFCSHILMHKLLLLSVFCVILSSCGKEADSGKSPYPGGQVPSDPLAPATTPGSPSAAMPGISYDVTVPADQRALIEQDLSTLNSINITDSSYTQVLGISDMSSLSLKKWLSDRTKFIIGQSYNDNLLAKVIQNRSFDPMRLANELDAETKVVTLMVNLGAAYYRQGKRDSKVYSLPMNGTYIDIKSPRVGIIQIGEGHFSANRVSGTDLSSLANRLLRLTVLFHEARHTDGNGTNVAFPHRTCTSGTYSGNAACEANLNGPYMVELVLLNHFYSQCTNCSSSELSTFQAKIADKLSRLTDDAAYSDPTPEAIR